MANILDYITWRGDLTFKQAEFNEVDNLILSAFSYLPLDAVFFGDKKITIKQAYSRAISIGVEENEYIQKGDKKLFPALANSKRFGELYITNFINKIDDKEEKQFSAVTIFLPDNTVYVSYRGTDVTLVGWKEDFNMSFSSKVPSQTDAVKYLENTTKITKKKLRVGGHSKGGNLAIYASSFCNTSTKKQIIEVYNNDGPGLDKTNVQKIQHREILNRIHTYIPQSSIIGRLLYNEGKYTIVESMQKGIMQHDLYSWQVLGNKFVCLDEVTNESEMVNNVIKKWLNTVDERQREEFIDIIYKILSSTNIKNVNELSSSWLKNAGVVLKTYIKTSEENKKIVSQTLYELINITKDNIIDSIQKPTKNKGKK